jgi:FkbH-like protein
MKLMEAFETLNTKIAEEAEPLRIALICSFTPLHLQTFLAAHLRLQFPDRKVQINTGLYGDFVGNLERLEKSGDEAAAVVMEWPDLDPRLGIRQLGGWTPADLADICQSAEAQLERVRGVMGRLVSTGRITLILSLPTLPLPPLAVTPGWQASSFELELCARMASLGAWAGKTASIRIVNAQALDCCSPPADRFDVTSEILSGFSYSVSHAAALADLMAKLVRNRVPKKGLITDLDDTLWRGILGEVGPEGIAWDMDHHAHIHGLYQQLLNALAAEGVLIAAASKNDPSLVDEAFRIAKPILPADRIFPFQIHWGRKSESVSNILRAWNVGADSVVFVDDSAMEIAEVQSSYPEIECFQFPKGNSKAAYELLQTLRDLFGKSLVVEEDTIRLDTLRRAATARTLSAGGSAGSTESFLGQAEAELRLSFDKNPPDPRALELVNKTNQFNLNGRRYSEAAWRDYLAAPGAFLMIAAYQDKFGPLGKIAVLAGRSQPAAVHVDVWVMSCRAFSRLIEHRCLQQLFERFEVPVITLDFAATPKNGPFQEFLGSFLDGDLRPAAPITRKQFSAKCPRMFHRVKEITRE